MRFASILFLIPLLFVGVARAEPSNNRQDGISVNEFRSLAKSLPELPGRIQAVQIFYDSMIHQNAIALATLDEKSDWRLFVFSSVKKGQFQLTWQSGKLADSFAISSQNELKVFSLEDEQAVQFEGCASHVCPDVFSILMYVPSKNAIFTADYVWGKVTFSANLETTENARYKLILNNLVRKRTEKQ